MYEMLYMTMKRYEIVLYNMWDF